MHNVPTDEVFVIGHKNPDTDSICSAIAYAHLKNQHENKFIPKRAGNINKETQFVLDYFGVKSPELVSNVNVQGYCLQNRRWCFREYHYEESV